MGQFIQNLGVFQHTQNSEVVHQARVGWRRFKSGIHLFEKMAYWDEMPDLQGLDFALALLSDLRDLDVAIAYVASRVDSESKPASPDKLQRWSQLEQRLVKKRQQLQAQVLAALDQPIVGATILEIGRWLEQGIAPGKASKGKSQKPKKVVPVLKRRISHWVAQLSARPRDAGDSATQHHTRILSKRLRYAVEALRPILPSKQVKMWRRMAVRLQTEIGFNRDLFTVMEIVASLLDGDDAS